jgi:exodeoxyribonuclease (lambda-induced)
VSRIGGLDERQSKYVALMRGGMEQKLALAEAGYKAAPSADTVRRALLGEDTSEPSDTARRYAADLAIERISGAPHGEPAKAWVLERGHEMETRARMLYEARTGAFITESGICLSDEGIYGYSSDGLADDDGLIEIKAPIDSIKIMDMWRTGDTSEYDHQMQGGMWLTARKWVDFIMYVPDLAAAGKDLFIKRIYRDEVFIDKMVAQLAAFDAMVSEYETILRGPAPITTETTMNETAPAPKNELAEALTIIAEQPAPDTRIKIIIEPETLEFTAEEQKELDAMLSPASPPPSLKLGQIGERLGFTLTADFLLSLGFAPAATEKNSKLFHEADFPRICAALQRHIASVQAKFQPE